MNVVKIESILGYPVRTDSVEAIADDICASIKQESDFRWLSCLNPHSYSVARENNSFSTVLKEADWLIPDGVGIVLASRIFRGEIRGRVTGSDVFKGVHERLNTIGGSVFFLGSTEGTLGDMRERLSEDYPNVRIVGTYSPPFKQSFDKMDNDAMVAAINKVAPDVLWVGLTSPKQDLWIYSNRHRLNVKFAAGVGAVFDFYAGHIERSHPIFQRMGLEWLPRLLREPRRLWRRMFVSAPIFLWDVVKRVFLR